MTSPLDHRRALFTTARRLTAEFSGMVGANRPDRLRSFERTRLEQAAERPTVLFLCAHNAGRSQMALGFLRHLAGDRARGGSGGAEPGRRVDPVAVAAMRERGIDISAAAPKPWTDELVRTATVVVTMGCGDTCPVVPGRCYQDWTLADPAGLGLAAVRPIRDEIECHVRILLEELGIPALT